ncbi:MAG: hypothetical protein AAGK97_01345 [Bacteroidota bacterium]
MLKRITLLSICLIYFVTLNAQNSISVTEFSPIPSSIGVFDPDCSANTSRRIIITLPAGETFEITGIDISYEIQAVGSNIPALQQSRIRYREANVTEPQFYGSSNVTQGALEQYSRSNVDIANGSYAGGTKLTFEMELFRTVGGDGCNFDHQFIPSNSFTITINYSDEINASKAGIGTSSPTQVFDVNGKIRVGDDNVAPEEGTIRFNKTSKTFEGYDGSRWVSFSVSNTWGEADEPIVPQDEDIFEPTNVLDEYGHSVHFQTSVYTIVGAPGKDNSGKIRILKRETDNFINQNEYASSEAQQFEDFGWDIAGTSNVVFVSAPLHDASAGADEGAVYAYTFDDGNLTFSQKIIPDDPQAGAKFGFDIAYSSGYLIVGAPFHSLNTGTEQGAAYIFDLVNGNWEQINKLVPSISEDEDEFGTTVAISNTKALVGAPNADDGVRSRAGYVAVYDRLGVSFVEQEILTSTSTSSFAEFGLGLALLGERAFISTNRGISFNGEISIYEETGGNYQITETLFNPANSSSDDFGYSIAISGTYLVVGAPQADNEFGFQDGLVYLYDLQNGSYQLIETLSAGEASADFGFDVEIRSGYIWVGAPGSSINATRSGKLYIFPDE